MRRARAVLGIAVVITGCGRAPDQSEIAASARSWARSAAMAASLWSQGRVPMSFARHTQQSASDGLETARKSAAQLPDSGPAALLRRTIDSAQRIVPALDSSLAHAHRDSLQASVQQLRAIAAVLKPLTSDSTAP